MKSIVVDANVLFAALLRNSTSRHVLLFADLDLRTPAHILDELDRNRPALLKRSHATGAAFDLLVANLRARIVEVPDALLRAHLGEANRRLPRDDLDAPYLAATLAVDGILWTNDAKLAKRGKVRTLTTKELLATIESA